MHRLLLSALLLLPVVAQAELQIENAWIKNLPPTVPVRAGYMEIFNPGAEALSIVGFSSEAFSSIDAHITAMKNGMMNMEHVPEISVEPGAKLILEPGGMHLMMHPIAPTTPGDLINITFTLSDDTKQSVLFEVKK